MSHNDQTLEKEDSNSSNRNRESIIPDENNLTVDGDCIVITTKINKYHNIICP
jgi:hypothetical protein